MDGVGLGREGPRGELRSWREEGGGMGWGGDGG